MNKKENFLRKIVRRDLEAGRVKEVVTRFPPEPNGFPHIGHAKAITVNFGIAREFGGRCHLRMDDTNPITEDPAYVEALEDAVHWLGFEWDGPVRHTSDYFERLYDYAVQLIEMGKAYVDSLSEEEIREHRGTVTEPGRRSRYAQRSVEENLKLFKRMREGEFPDGTHVLRARIDMAAANMKMRDPLLYRIRHAHHHRTGDRWAIYPMYDFAHCLSDAIEGVTHSFCTLEFENNRELYDWILDTLEIGPSRPHQYEFARLNLSYTVMSKRKLLELVEKGLVNGWDDPRLPTVAGIRRRGYTPESILTFCEEIGVAKANSVVDVAQLEYCIRDDLNRKAPRVMCVLDPLKVTIVNYEGSEAIEAPYFPSDVGKDGARKLPFSREIIIDRSDFSEQPPKGYYRLTPEQPVRLKHAYIIRCEEVIRDATGRVVELKARYYPDSKSGSDTSGIRVKSAIQWVDAAAAIPVEVRLYDRLFTSEQPQGIEDLNPDSLTIVTGALIEPAAIRERPAERMQFEREGYFYFDPVEDRPEAPVFNKIVSLKDSWAKRNQKASQAKASTPRRNPKKTQVEGEAVPMSSEEQIRFERYTTEQGLHSAVADVLARDVVLARFYEAALKHDVRPAAVARIVANEVAREMKHATGEAPKFTPAKVAALARMIDEGSISSKIAKELFEAMAENGADPERIVEERGLRQISDPEVIRPLIEGVLAEHPENLRKYREGNERLLGFFVGQALKASGGRANPQVVNTLVKEALEK